MDVSDVTTYGDGTQPYGGDDRSGQPLSLKDAVGRTKTFEYSPGADERGTSPAKTVTLTSFSADGTVRWVDGPWPGEADRTRSSDYPNRSVKTVEAPAATGSRAITDYHYDTVGRVVTTTMPAADAAGNRPQEIVTDTPSGDPAVTARASPASGPGKTDQVVRQFFNAHGEPIAVTGPREVNGQSEGLGVVRDGIEPPTPRFSGVCSTN